MNPVRLAGLERVFPGGEPGTAGMTGMLLRLIPRWREAGIDLCTPGVLAGFRQEYRDGAVHQFLGCHLPSGESPPPGMTLWTLDGAGLTVERPGDEAFSRPISWRWNCVFRDRLAGEFRLEETGEDVWMTVWAGLPEGDGADAVVLEEYDPDWPERFRAMKAWLGGLVPASWGRVEHYGSTAVPGTAAKPVIDILLEIPDFRQARSLLIPGLVPGGWEYWCYEEHMIFIRRDAAGRRTHHLHAAPAGHRLWRGLAFRDFLLAHSQVRERYVNLKRRLAAAEGKDREAYTAGKTAFVEEITRRALGEGKAAAG